MCSNTLAALNSDAQTVKRAQYEAFEFDLEAPGLVRVMNGSYGDKADEHTYRVTVENGVPVSCTCKADENGLGACKHRVAIAIREPVHRLLEAGVIDRTAVENHPNGYDWRTPDEGREIACAIAEKWAESNRGPVVASAWVSTFFLDVYPTDR